MKISRRKNYVSRNYPAKYERPKFDSLPEGGRKFFSKNVCVFIHGIFSDHETFDLMLAKFLLDTRLSGWTFAYFDYDYFDPIEQNAHALCRNLKSNFEGTDTEVTLVCHSMGGLVARLALLCGKLPFVRKIFLLGTPNLGAFRTSQLGPLAQAVYGNFSSIFGAYSRKVGILDLARIQSILKKYSGSRNADDVIYVTIPGLYYHENRALREVEAVSSIQKGFSLLNIFLKLTSGVSMEIPHDGIVEEASNCLIPCKAGRWSEKAISINNNGEPSYAHVEDRACQELTHVCIHHSDDVIDIVTAVMLKPTIRSWMESLNIEEQDRIRVRIRE